MRSTHIWNCLHCGRQQITACTIGTTCGDCLRVGHTDGFSTACPQCMEDLFASAHRATPEEIAR